MRGASVAPQAQRPPPAPPAQAPPPAAAPPPAPEAASPDASPEWARQLDQEEEAKKKREIARKLEIEKQREREFEERKEKERQRQIKEDRLRREENEKTRLLETLDKGLVELLEQLGMYGTLALPLAKLEIVSLKQLLATPRQTVLAYLSLNDMDALDQVVGKARRSVAIETISLVPLEEDAEWERKEQARREAEEREAELAEGARGHNYGRGSYYGRGGDSPTKDGVDDEDSDESPENIRKKKENEQKKPTVAGPLRKAMLEVVDIWYDYLLTVPALSETLDQANHGPAAEAPAAEAPLKANASSSTQTSHGSQEGDTLLGPSWKHTSQWMLWMLQHRGAKMGRVVIEKHLKLAQEHVWKALYPRMQTLGSAEWRLYWQRVKTSFEACFTDKGATQWRQAAAADARTAAVRAGKSAAEQDAAAAKAEKAVTAMLKAPPRKPRQPKAVTDRPPLPAPQGMAANLHLALSRSSSTSVSGGGGTSIPVALTVTGTEAGGSTASNRAAATERYREIPSRYLHSRVVSPPQRATLSSTTRELVRAAPPRRSSPKGPRIPRARTTRSAPALAMRSSSASR